MILCALLNFVKLVSGQLKCRYLLSDIIPIVVAASIAYI